MSMLSSLRYHCAAMALVSLAISGVAAESPVAGWDLGTFANGAVAVQGRGQLMQGTGTVTTIMDRPMLRLAAGEHLTTEMTQGPLAEGKPFAIEIEFQADDQPGGYHGGLVEAGRYDQQGVRILLQHDFRISVEHFPGSASGEPVYLVSPDAINKGRIVVARYEHDGKRGRLLINGVPVVVTTCPPPAPWSGSWRIGLANGDDYHFNGCVGKVRYVALETAR